MTKNDVEFIRGVNVEGPLGTLLERGLIRIAGRKDAPGRPMLYGTTRLFLEHFGLNTLKDLPLLNEFNENDLNDSERASIDSSTTNLAVEPKDIDGGKDNLGAPSV